MLQSALLELLALLHVFCNAAAFQESLGGLSAEVATMRFNSRGNMLAVGFRDNSMVQVIAYPSMRELVAWK
jgi:hypothetical protein